MHGQPLPDLVGRRNLWFGISLAAIILGMVAWATKGLNYGVDFTGGTTFDCKLPHTVPHSQAASVIKKMRDEIERGGVKHSIIQVSNDRLFIRTSALTDSERGQQQRVIEQAIVKTFPQPGQPENKQIDEVRQRITTQLVGPSIGRELTEKAITGTLIGLIGIMIWIWIRYNVAGDGFRYAVAGIAALFHDVLVMIGGFAIAGAIDKRIEADSSFVAALLTVVGFSINDSVVIFDRIRENLRIRRRDRFEDIVNDSLWQTMARSINTVLTVVFALVMLFLFGGESIRSFSLAMLIGIVSGAYSSIFNASPILVAWKVWDDKRKRAAGGPVRRAAVPPAERPAQRAIRTPSTPPSQKVPVPAEDGSQDDEEVTVPAGAAGEDKSEAAQERRRRAARRKRRRRF